MYSIMLVVRVLSVCGALLWLTTAVWGGQIVPSHIDTPDGFGPGRIPPPQCVVIWDAFNGQAIECDVLIPANTTELAGWGGYALDLSPFAPAWYAGPVGYMSTEVWHDGGTPHRLAQPHWPAGVFTLPDVFYPAGDGHETNAWHRVFARFWCVGLPGKPAPWCAASLTGHFRVSE